MYQVISANRSPKRAPKNWRIFEKEHRKNKFDLIEAPDYQGLLRKIKIARRRIKEGPIYFKGKTT